MLWTALAFFAVTALLMWLHVRGRAAVPVRAAVATDCPRCRVPVPPGASDCPGCRAPLQAFELVSAPVAAGPAVSAGPAHALVRADLCVGCGTCVDACPHPGALTLVDKVAMVDRNLCEGAGTCAAACPVGALVVSTGEAVQHVDTPDLDVHFQSNVPGLYVVGELGGRGLIKNAINEGKLAVEHVAATLGAADPARDGDPWDVIIVGSGPAGLSAALEAHRRGLRYLVLEQGTPSDTIRKYPRKKLLFAEPLRVPLYGDLWIADGSKESLLAVWENVIRKAGLRIETGRRVDRVAREEDRFVVAAGSEAWLARRVVLAMGRRGTPRRLGVAGEALDKVLFDIVEMEEFAGMRVLVVGGGDSAIESALGLANQRGTTVTLSYRGAEFGRVKARNREKIGAAIAAGRVEALLGSEVREIRPDVVALEWNGRAHLLPNDAVVVRIGGEAPYPFLERCGVRIVRRAVALDPAPAAAAGGG